MDNSRYIKEVNGKDCLGKSIYHVVIDECVCRELLEWLSENRKCYSVLYINDQLDINNKKFSYRGSRDDFVGMIAVLNSSVLVTKDRGFFENLNYKKILVDKHTSFKEVGKALDDLLKTTPVIDGALFGKKELDCYLDLSGKTTFHKLRFRQAIQEYIPEIEWSN